MAGASPMIELGRECTELTLGWYECRAWRGGLERLRCELLFKDCAMEVESSFAAAVPCEGREEGEKGRVEEIGGVCEAA